MYDCRFFCLFVFDRYFKYLVTCAFYMLVHKREILYIHIWFIWWSQSTQWVDLTEIQLSLWMKGNLPPLARAESEPRKIACESLPFTAAPSSQPATHAHSSQNTVAWQLENIRTVLINKYICWVEIQIFCVYDFPVPDVRWQCLNSTKKSKALKLSRILGMWLIIHSLNKYSTRGLPYLPWKQPCVSVLCGTII